MTPASCSCPEGGVVLDEHLNASVLIDYRIAPKGFAGVCCDIIDPASDGWELWMGKAEIASTCGERKPVINVSTVERSPIQ